MIIVIDTREQLPFQFGEKVDTIRAKLHTGDYSINGYEDLVAVERKSLADLWHTVTVGHRRWRETRKRFLSYPFRLIVIEGNSTDMCDDKLLSNSLPHARNPKANVLVGNLLSLSTERIPFFIGERSNACLFTLRYLERCDKLLTVSVAARLRELQSQKVYNSVDE